MQDFFHQQYETLFSCLQSILIFCVFLGLECEEICHHMCIPSIESIHYDLCTVYVPIFFHRSYQSHIFLRIRINTYPQLHKIYQSSIGLMYPYLFPIIKVLRKICLAVFFPTLVACILCIYIYLYIYILYVYIVYFWEYSQFNKSGAINFGNMVWSCLVVRFNILSMDTTATFILLSDNRHRSPQKDNKRCESQDFPACSSKQKMSGEVLHVGPRFFPLKKDSHTKTIKTHNPYLPEV